MKDAITREAHGKLSDIERDVQNARVALENGESDRARAIFFDIFKTAEKLHYGHPR